MRLAPLFVTTLLVLGVAQSARAADTVTKPAPGLTYLLRTTKTPNRIHALTVDLCAPGVSIRATAPSEKGKTVSSFAKSVKATAAINGGFFNLDNFAPSGLAIGDGKRWAGSKDDSYASFIAFGAQMADLPNQATTVGTPPAWMTEVVAGVQQVVKDGKAVTTFNCAHSGAPCTKAPRTTVGLSEDRRKLVIAVVDGRSTASAGMTVEELGPLMAGLGAHDAINLDGGGSSELWMNGAVKNRPSDGSERVVSNHLAILATGTGPAPHCNATAATTPAPTTDDPPPAAPGDETQADEREPSEAPTTTSKPKGEAGSTSDALPPPEAADDGGCTMASNASASDWLLALGGAALVLTRRRRHRSEPLPSVEAPRIVR